MKVASSLKVDQGIDPNSAVIKEYSLSEYKVFEQTLDPEDDLFITP